MTVTAGWGCMQWSTETAALQNSTPRFMPQCHQLWLWQQQVGTAAGTVCPPL